MYQPKKSFGLALMYKIHLERQAGHLEASHQYTQNTWAFRHTAPTCRLLGPVTNPLPPPAAQPSFQLILSLEGQPIYFSLVYLRCSNPGGYLHFLLLASSMREEEK